MGQEAVDNILKGLMIHQQKVNSQRDFDIATKRNEIAEQDRKERIKIEQDRLKNEKAHQDATIELTKKAADLMHMKAMQDVVGTYEEKGQIPTGGSVSTQKNLQVTPDLNIQLPGNLQTLAVPGQPDQTVRNPQYAAQQSAQLEQIRDRPKVEAKMEESRALQSDILDRQEEAKKADFIRTMTAKVYDDKRAEADRISREKIAAAVIAGRRAVESLRMGQQGIDLSPHIQDALIGQLSREDFSRMPLSKPDKVAIEVGVKAGGGSFLTREQQKVASDYIGLVDIVKAVDDALDYMPKTEGSGRLSSLKADAVGLTHSFDKDITDREERLIGYTTQIGRAVSKDNRVSDKDAEKVAMGYLPDKSNLFRLNVQKRENLVKQINDAIDAKLSAVPKSQRDLIKHKLGLDTIPPYGLQQGASPAASPNQVQNKTNQPLQWTPQGLVPIGQ